ncbi:MAG: rod shape-determining protein, partial [Muribaculaceae bacterium]|nr:rod shape-determining protein [Muribaculaceae bacterium]
IFKVGKTETDRPIGMMGNTIAATYDRIVARPAVRRNLRRVLKDRLGLEIKGILVTPLATGEIALSDQEKKLGCMLVDIGAETTTVTIYTKGNLVYFATLPLGGRNITRDLMSLNELEEKAEEFKLNFGNAIAPLNPSQEKIGRHRMSQISDLVVARTEEIVANIVEQVTYAGLTDKDIPEGIVLCGGGSRLNGIMDLFIKFTSMKVRMATLPSSVRIADPKGQGLETLEVAAIMYAGSEMSDDDCLEIPATPQPEPAPESTPEPEDDRPQKSPKQGFFSNIGKAFGKMFTPIRDDDEGEELI